MTIPRFTRRRVALEFLAGASVIALSIRFRRSCEKIEAAILAATVRR